MSNNTSSSTSSDGINIISDPDIDNNMDLIDDLKNNNDINNDINQHDKEKDIDTTPNNSNSMSNEDNFDRFIQSSQQEEWLKQVNTVKFSAGVPIATLKGLSKNKKIQNLINKINNNTNWIDYITTIKKTSDNKKELYVIITFPSRTELEKAKFIELDAYEEYLKHHESLKLSTANFPNQKPDNSEDQTIKVWDLLYMMDPSKIKLIIEARYGKIEYFNYKPAGSQ